jgi:xylose isomerase
MSTFEPGPEHRFAFGLPAIEPWEFVYELGDLGAWGVGVHDDDLVPCDAAPADRDDIVDKFTKALDSTGIVVSMVMTNLFEHPVFGHGAFTSPDRDVRRYAIQKTMRSIDLGAEFGARIYGLPGWREGVDSAAAKPPLDALDRYREAVDFLCAYACEQGYPTRFALECRPNEARGDAFLSTIGSALAFIDTLAHPEMVGLDPEIAHGSMGGSCGYQGVAQAIDARKLFHIDLYPPPVDHHEPEPSFGSTSANEAFFLVKLLEESGYDGPVQFDIDSRHVDDPEGIRDFVVGCMRTYRALAAKVRRFADDPEIRDAMAECGALELAEPTVGTFSAEAGRKLTTELFDHQAMAVRRYRSQRLDQLVVDLVLGLR